MGLLLEIVFVFTGALVILYFYLTRKSDYWKKANIPHVKASFPFGMMKDVVFQKRASGDVFLEIYRKYENEKVVGCFQFTRPTLIIQDPNIVHKILVNDFFSFRNNDSELDEEWDPILARNIFFQRDELWKKNRALITPAFTVGKIKHMFPSMLTVAGDLVKYLEAHPEELNLKKTMARYTSEIVARCALGVEGGSFTDENPDMLRMGNLIFGAGNMFKMLIFFVLPIIAKLLKMRAVPQEVVDYFNSILRDVIVYRQEHDEQRLDLIQFLIEVKRKTIEVEKGNIQSSIVTKTYTDDDILSGCVMFFIEQYETSSVALSFLLYNLAIHRNIQEKVRQEVEQALKKNNGELTFETASDLPYLQSVIYESHRLYPAIYIMSKVCTENYELDLGKENPLLVERGTPIQIPVIALHRDPTYWPEPEKFKPERFANNEDATARARGIYLPFGDGPRMCIGIRIASVVMKTAIAHIVSEFEIVPSEKTPTTIVFDPSHFLMGHKGGLHAKFVKRAKS